MQEEVYEEVSQLVQSALDGYKVCIFAYGQTGSGKTHTMVGPSDAQNRGVIPRAVHQLFKSSKEMEQQGWNFEIKVRPKSQVSRSIHWVEGFCLQFFGR